MLEEYDDTILEIEIEPYSLDIADKAFVSLGRKTLIVSEIIERTVEKNDEEEYEEEEDYFGKPYTTCHDCGKPISHRNEGGNGFCVDCAPNH